MLTMAGEQPDTSCICDCLNASGILLHLAWRAHVLGKCCPQGFAPVGKGSGWIRSRDFQLEGFCGTGMMQVTAIDAFAETSTLKPLSLHIWQTRASTIHSYFPKAPGMTTSLDKGPSCIRPREESVDVHLLLVSKPGTSSHGQVASCFNIIRHSLGQPLSRSQVGRCQVWKVHRERVGRRSPLSWAFADCE